MGVFLLILASICLESMYLDGSYSRFNTVSCSVTTNVTHWWENPCVIYQFYERRTDNIHYFLRQLPSFFVDLDPRNDITDTKATS